MNKLIDSRMEKIITLIAFYLLAGNISAQDNPVLMKEGNKRMPVAGRSIIMTEQAQTRILMIDQSTGQTAWEWKPADSPQIPPDRYAWFNNPSEVKPIYGCRYILMVASGGAVAIVRIADKKVMFYAQPDGNTHSAEILPDGNLVTASSTGATLKIYKVDTVACYAASAVHTYPLPDGHNVVWDKANNLLWATSDGPDSKTLLLHTFTYNNKGANPALAKGKSYPVPAGQTNAHDLFPDYQTNSLLLSTMQSILSFDTGTKTFSPAYPLDDIKSVSSGPSGFPVIVLKPVTEWWSDKVLDTAGNIIFERPGCKIYKARWFLDNPFSYTENADFRQP